MSRLRVGRSHRFSLLPGCLLFLVFSAGSHGAEPPEIDRGELLRRAAAEGQSYWRTIAESEPYPSMSCRKLFHYARALSGARLHPQRLARLFELAERMQDRDPASPGYGNFHWYWRDDRVTDRNAVEFCMQDAAVLWMNDRDWLPGDAREELRELLEHAIEGCLRHRVRTSYTNIAILNAGNLVVLGEMFDRPRVSQEGYRRLDAICLWTWQFGTHEFVSPTYYAVDLDGLQFIASHARRESGRRQAKALLELFWTDIALNWFPAAEKVAGAQSRSYDYLRGLGGLDNTLWANGWFAGETPDAGSLLRASLAEWTPPDRLMQLSRRRLPRRVEQSWGDSLAESRTHMLYPDVTLSCAGAAYGLQDMPLTVDLPGDRKSVRCYFIADGREDPYGVRKYGTGSAGHMKALHLKPFWAAAQRTSDALGVVIYRDEDLAADVVGNVQSHFVFRGSADGIWLRGEPIEALAAGAPGRPASRRVGQNDPLVLRYGAAAVGVRLLWARRQDGAPAVANLVDDGDEFGALRLTVDHRSEAHRVEAGAAFWIRVGSGLKDDRAMEAWRTQFERARPVRSETSAEGVRFEAPGMDGRVSVSARAPYGRGEVELAPRPTRGVLVLDDEEIGRPMLESLDPIRAFREQVRSVQPIVVPAGRGVAWEAENGVLFPAMTASADAQASGGRSVFNPKDDEWGLRTGAVAWPLRVARAGRYWLWGRVCAPDPETDSFYVELLADDSRLIRRGEWHVGRDRAWRWRPLTLDRAADPTFLELPAGAVTLQFRVREAGTKIDRLFLTSDAKEKPGAD